MSTDRAGSAVTYRAAQGLERALADVEAQALIDIPVERIVEAQDAHKIAAENLVYLAFDRGVTLWDDDWPEYVKRQWIHDQWTFKAKRGTAEAISMALGLWGFDLVECLVPPQGFYATPELTKEQSDAWLARMPEIRIYLGTEPGTANDFDWFAADGFSDFSTVGIDDGWALYGRKAVLRQNGVDTPLKVLQFTERTETLAGFEVERVQLPGLSRYGFIAGESFADDPWRFADQVDVEAQLVTVRMDRTYQHTTSELGVTTVVPGLTPIDVRYERDSDVGVAVWEFYAGDGFSQDAFATEDPAPFMLADRIRLLDPEVSVPMTTGISFAGIDRVGMPPYTAELQIDLHQTDHADSYYADHTFAEVGFVFSEDTGQIDRAMQAIAASKALRDQVLVSFAPVRPIQVTDVVGPHTRVGDWVRELL